MKSAVKTIAFCSCLAVFAACAAPGAAHAGAASAESGSPACASEVPPAAGGASAEPGSPSAAGEVPPAVCAASVESGSHAAASEAPSAANEAPPAACAASAESGNPAAASEVPAAGAAQETGALSEAPQGAAAEPSAGKKKYGWELRGNLDASYSNSSMPAIGNTAEGPVQTKKHTDKISPLLELRANYKGENGFAFKSRLSYTPSKEKVELRDFEFTFPMGNKQSLRAGRFKTPFGIEGSQSSDDIMICNDSAVTDALYTGRGWGASFEGRGQKGSSISLGYMTYKGDHHKFTSSDSCLFMQLRQSLGKKSHWGGSAMAGTCKFSDGTSLPVMRTGLEYQHIDDKLRFDSEIIYSRGFNGVSRTRSSALGAYAGASYNICGGLDGVLFADWFDPDLSQCRHDVFDYETNAKARAVAGLNYYFDRDLVHRIMLNYEYHISTEGPSCSGSGFYVKYRFSF